MQEKLNKLKETIAGEVILPKDSEYTKLKDNYKKEGSPAVIVKVKSNSDVVNAITFARDNKLELSVRSGGHSMIGASTNDGGMVIHLSYLDAVEVIDVEKRIVRIGAGARWGNVAKELSTHELAISSGDTNQVGVGGLTLGGGIGWMVRKYGLTIDQLIGAEIVTADGSVLRVSDQENRDLFWAIRGGGGNFGVVTSFDFIAHPCKKIVGGNIVFDVADREKVLLGWGEYMRNAHEDLTSTLLIMPGFDPKDPTPQLIVSVCYASDDESVANAAIQPILELGIVKANDVGLKPYTDMIQDAPERMPFKVLNMLGFIKTLNADVMKTIAAHFGQMGTALIQLRSLGGAMARVDSDATAFAHRNYEAMAAVATFVQPTTTDEQSLIDMANAWAPVKSFNEGSYVNFLTDDLDESIESAYPPKTYERLAKIKAAFDSNNIFHHNINIKPINNT